MLRLLALIVAFAAITGQAQAAAAVWEPYTNDRLGYTVQFPGKPTEGTGVYRADLITEAPTHFATLKLGDATFTALTIETNLPQEGAILMGEFEYWLAYYGDIALNTVSRLNIGSQYGRFITIDCRDDVVPEGPLRTEKAHEMMEDAANLVCPNGARMTANIFFTLGRLYAFIGVQAGPNAKVANAPGRFVNSAGWSGPNSAHARTLTKVEEGTPPVLRRPPTFRNLPAGQ
jgi:hypothetical protein